LEMEPEFLDTDGEHQHDLSVSSCSVRFDGELNHSMLRRWISELTTTMAADLFRYKGVLSVQGCPAKFVFQGVHMLFAGGFEERFRWKPDEVRECRLVFIGRNLDKKALEEGVLACKASDAPLRFKVGDSVEACVGEFIRGTIIALWDQGNPYRIRLTNGDEVWGPLDDDEFVRKCEGKSKVRKAGAKKPSPWWDGSQEGARTATK